MPSASRLTPAVVIAGVAAFLPLYCTQPLLPELRRYFAAGELRVSLTISAVTAAVAIASPVIGILADVVGRKRVIVPAIFLLSLPTLLAATAGSLDQLILWRFLQGLCIPGIIAVTIAYIAEEAPPGTAGRVTAAYVAGTVLGGLVGRLLAAVCADHLSWRTAFLVLGVLTLSSGLLVWWLLPPSSRFRRTQQPLASARAMLQHLRNPRLLATYLVGFNVLFSLVGIFTYANFYLAAPPFHLSTTALGLVFLVYALGVVVTPASGPFIDRLGHRKSLVYATGIVCAGALLTLFPHVAAVVLGMAILSTGVFISQSAASSHVAHAAQHTRSAATGLYVAFYYLGGSTGATVLGIAWHAGHWPACVATVLLMQFLAAATAYAYFTRPIPKSERRLTPTPSEIS